MSVAKRSPEVDAACAKAGRTSGHLGISGGAKLGHLGRHAGVGGGEHGHLGGEAGKWFGSLGGAPKKRAEGEKRNSRL